MVNNRGRSGQTTFCAIIVIFKRFRSGDIQIPQRLRDPKNNHCVQVCFSSAECFDSSAFKSKLPQKKNFNLHVGPIGPIFLDLRSKRSNLRSKLENLQLKKSKLSKNLLWQELMCLARWEYSLATLVLSHMSNVQHLKIISLLLTVISED